MRNFLEFEVSSPIFSFWYFFFGLPTPPPPSQAYPISFCYPRQLALHYHRLLWNATKTRVVTGVASDLHATRGGQGPAALMNLMIFKGG